MQPESHFREGAIATTDSDQREAGAGDNGVAGIPDSRRNRNCDEVVRGVPVIVRQQADRLPASLGMSAANRFHHTILAAT